MQAYNSISTHELISEQSGVIINQTHIIYEQKSQIKKLQDELQDAKVLLIDCLQLLTIAYGGQVEDESLLPDYDETVTKVQNFIIS